MLVICKILVYPSLLSSNNDPWSPTALNNSTTTQSSDILMPFNNKTTTSSLNAPPPNNDPWAAFETSTSTTISQQFETKNDLPPPSYDSIMGTNQEHQNNIINTQRNAVKTPDHFLGENSSLVNLDNLMGPKISSKPGNFFYMK